MPIMNQTGIYPNTDAYWNLVRETLKQVFEQQENSNTDELQRKIDDSALPTNERQIFYHAEPLDVAADIAGRQPTPEQVNKYLSIAKKHKWELHQSE